MTAKTRRGIPIVVLCTVFGAAISYAEGATLGLDDLAKLKHGRTMRASSSDPNWVDGNGDARPIQPGETLELAELDGPGVINHIWFTIASNERGYSSLLTLRMYWDDETEPSVQSPIGDFFGVGHGMDVPYDSLPVRISSDGRGRNCYWSMPFRKKAKLTVTNDGEQPCLAFYYYIDWRKEKRLSARTPYFHAMYRQEHPTKMGQNYLLADIRGNGHYVGTVLSCRQHLASWWGEGDDFFFIDGEKAPSLLGTGTEDYFCDGWGFRKQNGLYYGAPLVEPNEPGGRSTVYRWHITDPVIFKKSLRVEIEHKGVTFNPDGKVRSGFEEREDDFSSVAYWYQLEPHQPLEPMPAGKARLYRDYSKLIEGESLLSVAKASEGAIDLQELGGASGGKHLWWRPATEGQVLTLPVDVKDSGTYELLLLLTASWDYGVFDVQLDGKSLGKSVDLYKSTVQSIETAYMDVPIAAGAHILSFVNRGKNSDSKGYLLGFDGYLLTHR